MFAILLLELGVARADWAGFNRFAELAEVAVESGELRLTLRLAQRAVPQDLALTDSVPTDTPPWLARRLPTFLGENGKPLAGRLQSLGKAEALAKDGGKDAYYEAILNYPLGGQATGLSLVPPAEQPAIGLVVVHRGVPVSDLVPLEKTTKLSLDWGDPWRSRFDNPDWVRRHAEPRSYVYVEPYEVRHELLVRFKDIQSRLDLGLKDSRRIEESEREAVKRKIGALLLQRNPLTVDGASPAPQLDRVEFVRFSRTGVLPVTEPGSLDTDTALVGVVLAYLTETQARSVTLHWDLFEGGAGRRQVSLNIGKESFDADISPKQPVFEWTAEESIEPSASPEEAPEVAVLPGPQSGKAVAPLSPTSAVLALLLVLVFVLFAPSQLNLKQWGAGVGLMLVVSIGFAFHSGLSLRGGEAAPPSPGLDEAQVKPVLQALLHNAYRAFQLRDEEKAYDRLAKSLDGDLLDEIYLQQRRAILRQAEGMGGEGKVNRIEVLEATLLPSVRSGKVYELTSRWMAHGSVSHWGHSHERHNLYQARLQLRAMEDGQWKIVGLEFLEGRRLDSENAG